VKIGALIVLLASSVGIAFAQATPVDGAAVDPWLKAGVAVCSLTALIWVVQHLLRNTIPQQETTYRETLDKISEKSEKHDERFFQTLNEITDSCRNTQQRWLDESRRNKE